MLQNPNLGGPMAQMWLQKNGKVLQLMHGGRPIGGRFLEDDASSAVEALIEIGDNNLLNRGMTILMREGCAVPASTKITSNSRV